MDYKSCEGGEAIMGMKFRLLSAALLLMALMTEAMAIVVVKR